MLFAVLCAHAGCSEPSDESIEAEVSDDEGEVDEHPTRLTLRAPDIPEERPALAVIEGETDLIAYQLNSPIFDSAGRDASIKGIIRRGDRIARERVFRRAGCSGWWYEVPGGYTCSRHGFKLGDTIEVPFRPADRDGVMPYRYAMVVNDDTPRLYRVPTGEELELLGDPESSPRVLESRLNGDYFVALDRAEEDPSGTSWWRSIRGRYVSDDDLEHLETPEMIGEALDDAELPIAFVFGEERPLYRIEEGIREVGTAEKHARLSGVVEREIDGERWVVADDGRALRREHVRLAVVGDRSERIPSGAHWIHVNLAEQTLVAYEGGEPVYATLVSSGKEGYDTPAGVFRIREKYVSITMSGEDPIDGPYEVEEVPWTMYYFESYALHGAYWHDDFGRVRSHGCTNIAPADARWLFRWTSPEVPAGWHARRLRKGTWVQLTRDAS